MAAGQLAVFRTNRKENDNHALVRILQLQTRVIDPIIDRMVMARQDAEAEAISEEHRGGGASARADAWFAHEQEQLGGYS
jgi:hypothetical protein